MKTAIYIEDGAVQLVITPESEFEKNAFKSFESSDGALNARMFVGAFYDCRGGWTRQRSFYPGDFGAMNNEDRSLILRMEPPKVAEAQE